MISLSFDNKKMPGCGGSRAIGGETNSGKIVYLFSVASPQM